MLRHVFDTAKLSAQQLSVFMTALSVAEFAPGDFIVNQGDLGDRFYVIEKGEVTVEEARAGEAEPRLLTRLYSGAFSL